MGSQGSHGWTEMHTFRLRGKHWGDLGYTLKLYGTQQPCPHSGWTWKGHVGSNKSKNHGKRKNINPPASFETDTFLFCKKYGRPDRPHWQNLSISKVVGLISIDKFEQIYDFINLPYRTVCLEGQFQGHFPPAPEPAAAKGDRGGPAIARHLMAPPGAPRPNPSMAPEAPPRRRSGRPARPAPHTIYYTIFVYTHIYILIYIYICVQTRHRSRSWS